MLNSNNNKVPSLLFWLFVQGWSKIWHSTTHCIRLLSLDCLEARTNQISKPTPFSNSLPTLPTTHLCLGFEALLIINIMPSCRVGVPWLVVLLLFGLVLFLSFSTPLALTHQVDCSSIATCTSAMLEHARITYSAVTSLSRLQQQQVASEAQVKTKLISILSSPQFKCCTEQLSQLMLLPCLANLAHLWSKRHTTRWSSFIILLD